MRETDRLLLTPLAMDDIDISIAMFTDSDVTRFAGGPVTVETIEKEMPKWVQRGSKGGIGIWCAKDKATGEKLGTGALLPQPVEEDDTDFSLVVMGQLPDADIEVGYFFKPSAWGRGYATEVCRELLRIAFELENLEKVVAAIENGNAGSRNVLEKSGFQYVGLRKTYGEMEPHFIVTRDEWQSA